MLARFIAVFAALQHRTHSWRTELVVDNSKECLDQLDQRIKKLTPEQRKILNKELAKLSQQKGSERKLQDALRPLFINASKEIS